MYWVRKSGGWVHGRVLIRGRKWATVADLRSGKRHRLLIADIRPGLDWTESARPNAGQEPSNALADADPALAMQTQ